MKEKVTNFVGNFAVKLGEHSVEKDSKQRTVPAWIMTAVTVYGAITLVVDVTYLLTGVDAKEWARENVVIPFYESAKTMKLYSASGGITNPYPPNSYQYHQYNKTNYYWVVE